MTNKILYIASLNPFVSGGGAQATLAYMESVLDVYGRANVDIMIPEECVILPEYRDLQYIKVRRRNLFKRCFDYIFGNLSRFTNCIVKTVKKNNYSLCIINGGVIAGNVVKIIKRQGTRVVVIHHNHEPEYHADNKTIESLKGHFLYFIKNAEKKAYKYADKNLFLTNQDMNTFLVQYGMAMGQNYVIGCYETKYSEKIVLKSNDEKKFLIAISGSLCSYQTVEGFKDFCFNYLKIAKVMIPNLRILVTGKQPAGAIMNIIDKDPLFNLVANPDRILEIVSLGKIFLCPTNIGGGLKLRVMDGLKCGMPILVHKTSARGYDYYYNKPYFKIYNDEQTFYAGLSQLLKFIAEETNFSEIIVKDFVSYFGYESGTNRLQYILESKGK